MTLQQLRYIVAIDRYRNFARAAAELDVTQPTLSALLVKLEDELGVRLFERNNKSVRPTAIGETVIRQAEAVLNSAARIEETVAEQKGEVSGPLSIGVGPTIAPYLMPRFIKGYTGSYPHVKLTVNEMKGEAIVEALRLGKIDLGIAVSGLAAPEIEEKHFYSEPFHVYMAKDCLIKMFHHHTRNASPVSHPRTAGKRSTHRGRLRLKTQRLDLHTQRFHPAPHIRDRASNPPILYPPQNDSHLSFTKSSL